MNFKKILNSALALGLAAQLVLPAVSLAQTDATGKVFCTRLSSVTTEVDQRIADRKTALDAKTTDRQKKLTDSRAKHDAKLSDHRAKWADNRNKEYTALDAKATTDAQKQAVASFKASMEAAITARKTAVDAAVKAFRQGIDQAIASRKAAVSSAITSFRNAVASAKSKAKTDCAAGVDAKTVRENYRIAMKAALDAFQTDRANIDKKNVQDLVKTRRTAVDKALNDFKTAAEKARADLKAALKAD